MLRVFLVLLTSKGKTGKHSRENILEGEHFRKNTFFWVQRFVENIVRGENNLRRIVFVVRTLVGDHSLVGETTF